MKSISITVDEAVTLLREIAGERPEYVYDEQVPGTMACRYFVGEKPSCIIGQLLARKYVTPADLTEAGVSNTSPAGELFDAGVIADQGEVQHLLLYVQHIQDEGVPWGEAVERVIAGLDRLVE
jgi:hypothetical protein